MGPEATMGRCGRYDLIRRIGIGGMGEVFLARVREGPDAGKEVAIKRLLPQCASDPVFIGMFLDEARLTRRLIHPNVCQVLEHGQADGRYFLAMEHIDGVPLKEILFAAETHREHLPVSLVSWVIAQPAPGLDSAPRLTAARGVHCGVASRRLALVATCGARSGLLPSISAESSNRPLRLIKTTSQLSSGSRAATGTRSWALSGLCGNAAGLPALCWCSTKSP